MALERLKRKATELFYGPATYMPPRKRLKPKSEPPTIKKKHTLTRRTKVVKQQLKNAGLSDKDIARFMK